LERRENKRKTKMKNRNKEGKMGREGDGKEQS
jgi:hypothetical protein